MERAFEKLRAPVETLTVTSERARQLFGFDLLLARPDLHVAWRGNKVPENPQAIADRVTGHCNG